MDRGSVAGVACPSAAAGTDAALGARQRLVDAMERGGDELATAETLYYERLSDLGKVLGEMVKEGMAVPAVDESLRADAQRRGIAVTAGLEG